MEHKFRPSIVIPALLFLIGSIMLFASCYPGEALSTSEADLVTTFYNKNANFATKMTYARPDRAFNISDPTMGSNYDATIIAAIDQNMTNLGFTKTDTLQADVTVIPLVTASTWVGGSCYPSYYYPYYGWCYPYTYSFTTGTVLLVMIDPHSTSNSQALWVAGLNGLVEGSDAQISSRITTNINQAFEQSPYLGAGK